MGEGTQKNRWQTPFWSQSSQKSGILSSEETMEGAGANNKANKQFDELEGAEEPQIFSLAVCRLDLSNM